MNISKNDLGFIKNEYLSDKLLSYIKNSPKENLFHIDVYALADEWSVDRKTLLNYFIEGVYNGVFSMEWNYHCSMCGGVAKDTINIHEATSENHCDLCRIDFKNTIDKNVEVSFSIHKNIVKLPSSFKEKWMKYMTDTIMKTHKYEWKTETTIYGSDIIQNDLFRNIFEKDVLMSDQSLEIERAAILFTDIKGSTQLYTDLGDAKAFSLVSEHFRILFKSILNNNGIPIKTIGDAVMGSFVNTYDALKASLEAQKEIVSFYKNRGEKERIEVKIGLHTGSALVVTLNGKLDYFGSTVNLAARIQSAAKPNEVAFSKAFLTERKNLDLLKKYSQTLTVSKNMFKGINDKQETYRIYIK